MGACELSPASGGTDFRETGESAQPMLSGPMQLGKLSSAGSGTGKAFGCGCGCGCEDISKAAIGLLRKP